jgi:hypothetical protein
MSDIDHKRGFVSSLYPHRGWKKKVARMGDAQVVAIFLREQAKAHETKPKPKEDSNNGDIPF